MSNLVTVVIPVYNGEKYISGCVCSLKAQTYRNIEVIFVDDGSTDNSGRLCEKAAREDVRFHVIHQPNGGTARARNTGLDAAEGKYIAFLDVDDEYEPQMIQKLVSLIEKEQADLAICGFFNQVDKIKDGQTVPAFCSESRWPSTIYHGFSELKDDYISIWDTDIFSVVWNKLFCMEMLQREGIRFRDGHVYTEDRVFNRAVLPRCGTIAITAECLYHFIREHTGSTTEKYRDNYFAIRDMEYNEFKEHFQSLGIWDEKSREYTSREFVERIAGSIENVFHAGKALTARQKYQKIRDMISHPDVREALQFAKCRSLKMRFFILPIRWKWTFGAYGMGETIYWIRKCNPALFHRLKATR